MVTISAFADEISPDPDEQIAALSSEGIKHLELRGAWNTNVLDLDDAQLAGIKFKLDQAGIAVSAIGSPIGKVAIDASFDDHVHRFERAIIRARFFGAAYIRVFSFYPPAGAAPAGDWSAERDTVLHHLRELTARARAADVILLHENEKDIYGDTIARCVDVLQTIDDPYFAAAFDPANFIQCGQRPYPDAYDALQPWLRYVHVKDATQDGVVVAAGEGVADWPAILARLRDEGYAGFLSLEPHLAAAGQFSGFSGPERFSHAARALKGLLGALDWPYA
jgi:sugar phosphate isomerase/epimerase